MGYLEKVFLGTLVLFGAGILFIFSLYFDVRNVVVSPLVRRPDVAGGAGFTDTFDRARRAGVPEEVMPKGFDRLRELGFSAPAEKVIAAYYVAPKQPSPEDLAAQKAKIMSDQGFQSQAYVNLQLATARDRDRLNTVLDKCDTLIEQGRYGEAAELVRAAIDQTDGQSMITLRELYIMLRECLFGMGDLEGTEQAVMANLELQRKIHEVELGEPKLQENARFVGEARKFLDEYGEKQAEVRETFRKLRERKAEHGSPTRLSASEMARAKLEIIRSFERGEIDEEEKREALAALDELQNKKL